ncbi:MAG: hypothetical protein ABW101_11950 [Candidatus Thiodiazotropha sp.]
MKKISMMLFACLLLSVFAVHAENPQGKGQFMKYMAHANPVPNYVAVIRKNAQALNITDAQMEEVMAWNKANTGPMQEMVMSVISGEKQMADASMAGTSADEIMAMAKKVEQTRLDIIAGKTRCRDRMLEILDKDQWEKLTAMVKAM